ncbi:MAG: hypothetical protein FWD27_06125 [Coriobacteriia bacterium]|nr:hypothetical protein [Coriobacteriia bacterium]
MSSALTKEERGSLEKRRMRAARFMTMLLLASFCALALGQCAQRNIKEGSILDFASLLDTTASQAGASDELLRSNGSRGSDENVLSDPLLLDQEGFVFMDANIERSILWYQSFWDVFQSRALLQRALDLKGWQPLSTDDEAMMCFEYAPSGLAGGGLLYASFYSTEEGCSVLIEVF